MYFGVFPHSASCITVEFSSNLHGTDIAVTWELRSFSLVTDFSDTIDSVAAFSSYQSPTVPVYPCPTGSSIMDLGGLFFCLPCLAPCVECFGSGSDQWFKYAPTSPESRLRLEGQTYLLSYCTSCAVENCPYCDEDINQCETCQDTCAQCDSSGDTSQCQKCTVESISVLNQCYCIASCPQGAYADSNNICCGIGCLECSTSN